MHRAAHVSTISGWVGADNTHTHAKRSSTHGSQGVHTSLHATMTTPTPNPPQSTPIIAYRMGLIKGGRLKNSALRGVQSCKFFLSRGLLSDSRFEVKFCKICKFLNLLNLLAYLPNLIINSLSPISGNHVTVINSQKKKSGR